MDMRRFGCRGSLELRRCTPLAALAATAAVGWTAASAMAGDGSTGWQVLVDTEDLVPGTDVPFLSFGQPSINDDGVVVFRGRTAGPGQPIRGVFRIRTGVPNGMIEILADTTSTVPDPNNTEYPPGSGTLARFLEFPSLPRIDRGSDLAATRGQSQPTWTYLLPDGSESRVGSAGVFAGAGDELVTAVGQFGAVRDADSGDLVFPWFSVPGFPEGTRFDQFPGSPAVSDGRFVVFKGNFIDPDTGEGMTGVYVRDLSAGPDAPVRRLADSATPIPGQAPGDMVDFGSTAPPSAEAGHAVFVGLDIEEAPTMGGIYLVPLEGEPLLQELVAIGGQVPGEPAGTGFTRLGEGLSFDGRFVAFWGAWGDRTRTIVLECPEDGQPALLEYCNELHPDGFEVAVPVDQGIFVHDTVSGQTQRVARTGEVHEDFLSWVFSGRVPGDGHGGGGGGGGGGEGDDKEPGDEELARWRSSAFVSVDRVFTGRFRVAYLSSNADVKALHLRFGPGMGPETRLLDTATPGIDLDPDAPAESVIVALGIERDGFRGGRLGLTASMLDPVTGESRAGLYMRRIRAGLCDGDLDGDGLVGFGDVLLVLAAWGETDSEADATGDGIVDHDDLIQLLASWGPCA
jgi:hypothetical protein